MSQSGASAYCLAVAAIWLTGYLVSATVGQRLSVPERVALALMTGLLAQSFLLLVLILFGLPTGRWQLLIGDLLLATLAGLLTGRQSREVVSSKEPLDRPSAVLLALAAVGVGLFAVQALARPMWATDYVAIWGLKAKMIFATGTVPMRLFHDPALYWSHPEYPLFLPLALSALATTAGGWNDRALAVLYPAFHLATVLTLFGFLRRRRGKLPAAIAACLCGLYFPLYSPVHVGTAEIPLALGMVLLACAALDALERPTAGDTARLALTSLVCAALKQEGTLLAILLAGAVVVLRKGRGRLLVAAALAGPAVVHWLIARIAIGRIPGRTFTLSPLSPSGWSDFAHRLNTALAAIAELMTTRGWVSVAGFAGILCLTRKSFADLLLPPLLLQVGAYVLAASLSALGVAWHVETSFVRITSALVPTLLLVLGARLDEMNPRPSWRRSEALRS